MADLLNEKFVNSASEVREAFGKNFYEDDNFRVVAKPFACVTIKNLLKDEAYLQNLVESLKQVKYHQKHNDLYRFKQSSDLKTHEDVHIQKFNDLLKTQVHKWLQEATGFELNSTIDIFAAVYQHGDRLLCHDDRLETRKVAFIYYLTENWSENDGGSLQLLEADQHGQPIMGSGCSVLPNRNTFAFFEVSPRSYHYVSEVLAAEKKRVSITGWFHADAGTNAMNSAAAGTVINPDQTVATRLEYHRVYSPHLLVRYTPLDIEEDTFMACLNVAYLNESTQRRIRKRFERTSEIELVDFLAPEMYEDLVKQLRNIADEACWKRIGPANRRNYFALDFEQLSQLASSAASASSASKDDQFSVLRRLCDLFKSEALFLTLGCLTGLNLHPLCSSNSTKKSESASSTSEAKPDTASSAASWSCVQELRKWTSGCYTLLSDFDDEPSAHCACADVSKSADGSAEAAANSASSTTSLKKRKAEEKRKRRAKRRRGETALDICFYIDCPSNSVEHSDSEKGKRENHESEADHSGSTTYVGRDDDEVLLTVRPKGNSLSIVYREPDTLKFVNYVRQSASGRFFDLCQSFYENSV